MNEEILLTRKLLHEVQKTEHYISAKKKEQTEPAPATKRQATKLS